MTEDLVEPAAETQASEQLEQRVVILVKGDLTAMLCLGLIGGKPAAARVDPRLEIPEIFFYPDAKAARRTFNKDLGLSKERGWSVAYDGGRLWDGGLWCHSHR